MKRHIRESLQMLPEEWARLNELAAQTDSIATVGETVGKPTWRALIRRIAQGQISVSVNHGVGDWVKDDNE